MPVRYNLSSVWVRLSIFSQLSIIQYAGLCVFSLPISYVMIERIYIYTLSYYHHQIGSMNYYPLFRVRSRNNGMRCMSFYILIGSDNGFSPGRRQAIIWTNDGILLIGPLGNKLQWNLRWNLYIFIQENAFETVVRKLAAVLPRPQCFNGKSQMANNLIMICT